eukprot:9094606-Pyramimonas_sp.AAC.1
MSAPPSNEYDPEPNPLDWPRLVDWLRKPCRADCASRIWSSCTPRPSDNAAYYINELRYNRRRSIRYNRLLLPNATDRLAKPIGRQRSRIARSSAVRISEHWGDLLGTTVRGGDPHGLAGVWET